MEELLAAVPDGWGTEAIVMANDRARALELKQSRLQRVAAASLPPFLTQKLRTATHRFPQKEAAARAVAGSAPRTIGWRDLVVCPVCRGGLVEEMSGQLSCAICRRRYEVNSNDVPCLLAN